MQRVLANRVTHLVKAFARNKLGSVLMMSGLMMPVLLGFAGLGLDVTIWYLAKRQIQTAADAGAISAAYTMAKGGTDTAAQAAADVDVALNDFVAGGSNTVVTNIPPATGAYTTDTNAAETIVTLSQPLYFMAIFGSGPIDIEARGVAAKRPTGEGSCIMGLGWDGEAVPTLDGAVEFSGTSSSVVNCGVTSNSNSYESIYIFGNATLDADPVFASGDITLQGNPTFTYDYPPVTWALPADDPYESLPVPTTPVDCLAGTNTSMNAPTSYIGDPGAILDPGRYCGGIKISNSVVTFNPGVYIIDSGELKVGGTSTLQMGPFTAPQGVTFIFTAADPNNIEGLDIEGGTIADLSAPTGGTYSGVLFFQDPAAPCCQGANLIENVVLGGSDTIFSGAMYFPSQELKYSGGSSTGGACLQIIANKVTFTGTSYLTADLSTCEAAGVTMVQQSWVRLVE